MSQWDIPLRIEHKIAQIITQQEINGWKFDLDQAHKYVNFLNEEQEKIYDEVRPLLRPEMEKKSTIRNPFTARGDISVRAEKYLGSSVDYLSGPFSPVVFREPDLGSRNKLMTQLSRHGWMPLEYTEKGNARLTEESLEMLEGGVGKDIARWYILGHRKSQIQGWMDSTRKDGRISARANPCGTPTGRMRHSTVVNVPKANQSDSELLWYPEGKVTFGTEMRSLFIAEEGYILVGYDSKGLELRILAHYMDDPEFREEVIHGDPHSYNQQKAGLDERSDAKTLIYALVYGASDSKLGTIVKGTAKDGRDLRKRILTGLPKLGRLVKRVEQASERGYIHGLDGRRMPIRKQHAALNTLIQGGGAVAMKVIAINLDKLIYEKAGMSLNVIRKVGDFHDEAQTEVKNSEKYIELFSNSVVKATDNATRFLKLRCPLESDLKSGPNWAYTH